MIRSRASGQGQQQRGEPEVNFGLLIYIGDVHRA